MSATSAKGESKPMLDKTFASLNCCGRIDGRGGAVPFPVIIDAEVSPNSHDIIAM
jgi:hypothetical protein